MVKFQDLEDQTVGDGLSGGDMGMAASAMNQYRSDFDCEARECDTVDASTV